MLSGRRLDLLDPSPLDIEIEDIAHGLARVARWNGQTSGDHAFSVAQHCVLVTRIFKQLTPQAKRVAGYQTEMPTFQGQISEEGLMQIIAYIKSLAATQPAERR